MNQPLLSHVGFLEDTVRDLRSALTLGSLSRADRELIQQKIEMAVGAIQSYRQAYEVEYVLRVGRTKENPDHN